MSDVQNSKRKATNESQDGLQKALKEDPAELEVQSTGGCSQPFQGEVQGISSGGGWRDPEAAREEKQAAE